MIAQLDVYPEELLLHLYFGYISHELRYATFHFILHHQRWAFFVTFGGYFMAHFSRKCYSTVKQQLQHEAGYSSLILSAMDTTFMATYAVGNIVSGKLGDTLNPTTVLAIGLFGSGACLFLINVSLWFDFVGFSEHLGNFFILAVYFMFGFFQSTGGPVGKFLFHMLCSATRLVCSLLPSWRIATVAAWQQTVTQTTTTL